MTPGEANGSAMDLEAHLSSFLAEKAGLARGDRAVVAVSGGVDSIALLAGLASPAGQAGVSLHVAYLDHAWRTSEAPMIVAEVAGRLGLPVTTGRLPPGWAASEGAARRARRQYLKHVADLVGARRIFLAHHADDQAETVLMHLAQGAGPGGMSGMNTEAEGFLRPFLDIRKDVLRAFVVERGLPFEEDPTNRDRSHLRNFLRHDVLAHVERRLPGSSRAIVRQAGYLKSDEAHFRGLVETILGRSRRLPSGVELSLTAGDLADEALLSRVALAILRGLGRRPTTGQVRALVKALKSGQGGAGRHLGVFPSAGGVYVGDDTPLPDLPVATVAAGSVLIVDGLAPCLAPGSGLLPGEGPWIVRSWRAGDVMSGHRTKVKEILGEAKVPRPFRSRVPLVEGPDGRIAAVAGILWPAAGSVPVALDPDRGRLVVGVPRPMLK